MMKLRDEIEKNQEDEPDLKGLFILAPDVPETAIANVLQEGLTGAVEANAPLVGIELFIAAIVVG